MISEIELQNFRSFRERQVIPLAPLTLVYGPNSAGKSSLIRSLMLLKQSALFGNGAQPMMTGPLVDFGSAKVVAHNHRGTASVSMSYSLPNEGHRMRTARVRFDLDADDPGRDSVSINLIDEERTHTLEFARAGENLELLVLARESLDSYMSLRSFNEDDPTEPLFREALPDDIRPVFAVQGLLPSLVVGRAAGTTVKKAVLTGADHYWNEFSARLIARMRSELESVSYLGPLRRPWRRTEPVGNGVMASGEGAGVEDSLWILSQKKDVLARLNTDLRESLESPYQLDVVNPFAATDIAAADVMPPMVAPILRHRVSGVEVSPVDAGFGLSQLLPIVIEMNVRRDSLICIEQPELHLHPRLQAKVGQLLRSAVKGANGNRFLIETHSEHLLLRIRRLIREGLLESDLVRILYVDNLQYDPHDDTYVTSAESHIQTIELDPDGDFVDPWPGGFFEERLLELPGWSSLAKEMPSSVSATGETMSQGRPSDGDLKAAFEPHEEDQF